MGSQPKPRTCQRHKKKGSRVKKKENQPKMSSLHWEARRRQNVADKMQMLAESARTKSEPLSKEKSINEIAETFCTDPAIPTHFMLNKSKAALSREGGERVEVSFEEAAEGGSQKEEKRYTARIPNRYTSM